MKRPTFSSSLTSRAVLIFAALTIVACDSDVNFSPTVPRTPNITVGARTLKISGSLEADRGSCQEATILYDGRELSGARTRCIDPGGCAKLELAAITPTSAGHHTVSFQLLRQSREAVNYSARGTVVVSRQGQPLDGLAISLGPTRARLRPGESVTFELSIQN